MANELKGLIFNIQRFSIHDGPGIRTTIFMKGCPLLCPWCSNPEGINTGSEIMTNDHKCISCKKCAEFCPVNAISFVDNMRTIGRELCNECLECAKVCPSHSIEVVGKYMSVDEAFKVAARDEMFYLNSSGGVTVSGGEPLVQWDFVLELLRKCKQARFHTAIDTSAYCKWENLEKVLVYTDLVLYDIKHMDAQRHKEKTGVTNELILENLEKTAKKAKVWLRIPLIPNYNDSEKNLRLIGELGSRVKASKVSLLPYHEWGKQKYARLGKEYRFDEAYILNPDDDIVIKSKGILESYDLKVTIGA